MVVPKLEIKIKTKQERLIMRVFAKIVDAPVQES